MERIDSAPHCDTCTVWVQSLKTFSLWCLQDESHIIFNKLEGFFSAKGLEVFNPTNEFKKTDASEKSMAEAVAGSQLVIAALSVEFFKSKWCQAEIVAAHKVGITIQPVFAVDFMSNTQMEAWLEGIPLTPAEAAGINDGGDIQASASQPTVVPAQSCSPAGRVLVSFFDGESATVQRQLVAETKKRGYDVSDPAGEPADVLSEAAAEDLRQRVRESSVVLVILSPGYFTSPSCHAELDEAFKSKVKVVPIFDGNTYTEAGLIGLSKATMDFVFPLFSSELRKFATTHPEEGANTMMEATDTQPILQALEKYCT